MVVEAAFGVAAWGVEEGSLSFGKIAVQQAHGHDHRPGERLPTHPASSDLPEHPDYPRILTVFNEATGPLRARDVCEALDHDLLPKNIEGTRAKLKRLVKLDVLTEIDTGSFTTKQEATAAIAQICMSGVPRTAYASRRASFR